MVQAQWYRGCSPKTPHKHALTLHVARSRKQVSTLPDSFPSALLDVFQLEEDRLSQHPLPRYSPLRRLASSVFSSSTLETEHYPHPTGTFIQRSRSAESSPIRLPHRRHAPLPAGNHRLVPSVLRISRSQLQQVWARFTHKT